MMESEQNLAKFFLLLKSFFNNYEETEEKRTRNKIQVEYVFQKVENISNIDKEKFKHRVKFWKIV